jgi:hypothetical protein
MSWAAFEPFVLLRGRKCVLSIPDESPDNFQHRGGGFSQALKKGICGNVSQNAVQDFLLERDGRSPGNSSGMQELWAFLSNFATLLNWWNHYWLSQQLQKRPSGFLRFMINNFSVMMFFLVSLIVSKWIYW